MQSFFIKFKGPFREINYFIQSSRLSALIYSSSLSLENNNAVKKFVSFTFF